MGFFTRSDKAKEPAKPKKLKSASLSQPPNVYVPAAPPVYKQANASTPHLGRERQTHKKKKQRQEEQRQQQQRPQPDPYAGNQIQRYQPQQPDPYAGNQVQRYQPQPDPYASNQVQRPQFQDQIYGPVVVNQHYYIGNHEASLQPPLPPRQPLYGAGFSASVGNLTQNLKAVPSCGDGLSAWYGYSTNVVASTVNACDDVARRLNKVLTLIDGEHLAGDEVDLFTCQQASTQHHKKDEKKSAKGKGRPGSKDREKDKDKARSHDVFAKVQGYANSRLPRDLTPFSATAGTWRLLCTAARYSLSVYDSPSGAERETHVSSDWLTGTKAMCIKSVPMDDASTIVFAIRGTASFMDWAVNLKAEPRSPDGFLDDGGNLCHAGFLSVARRMVKPVAARLRQLLREDPGRERCCLVITGHSAGGAVASLLYSHMLAQAAESRSELNTLTARFRRVHCVTFGAPPVSLMPLTGPECPRLRRSSLFLAFVNEGDPVTRADKGYVKSLLELLGSPGLDGKSKHGRSSHDVSRPVWPVPPCTLSNAGHIVVLREHHQHRRRRADGRMATVRHHLEQAVTAHVSSDEQLRGVIWSDPMAHLMQLYAGRVESLAVQAVTGK